MKNDQAHNGVSNFSLQQSEDEVRDSIESGLTTNKEYGLRDLYSNDTSIEQKNSNRNRHYCNLPNRRMLVILGTLIGTVVIFFVNITCGKGSPLAAPPAIIKYDDAATSNVESITATNAVNGYAVLLTCSDGFYEMFQNWLHFFMLLKIPNLRVFLFAEDENTLLKCNNETTGEVVVCLPWSFVFSSDATDSLGANSYDSGAFAKLTGHRPHVIQRLMEETGQSIIFSDADVIWKKNPIPFIEAELIKDSTLHLIAQDDGEAWGAGYCTGFVFYMSCPATDAFIQMWKEELEHHDYKIYDQYAFNKVLPVASEEGVDIQNDETTVNNTKVSFNSKLLPKALFFSGNEFSKVTNITVRDGAVVVHNNWIVGYEAKIERFRSWGLWAMDNKEEISAEVKSQLNNWCGGCKGNWGGNCEKRVQYLGAQYKTKRIEAMLSMMNQGHCMFV